MKVAVLPFAILMVVMRVHAGSSGKFIIAVRTDEPPRLDGIVNESQWQKAGAVLDFTQFDPKEGSLPSEQTSVRMLYDDHAIYVGVICYDAKPDLIVHQLTRRDRSSEAERFTVQIDSYHDHQTAFVFSTNVSGVQSDGVLSQDGAVYDITFDAVWSVKTATYLDGWSAEFEIPYDALRFSEQEGNELDWGINFRRYISRKHETIEWIMVPRSERLQISRWGHVRGLKGISPPLHLNISPYVSGSATVHPANSSWLRTTDHSWLAGLDLKYGITRNFTLDATVNPDFGQVEVDQAVLNLTVFETRFPEKRPFFVEGSQLFTFGAAMDNTSMPLFFSRRIGKRPSMAAATAAGNGESIKKNPSVTTILGAAKISGHTNAGLSVGALGAVTDEENAVLGLQSGKDTTLLTEPRSMYSVLRLKQDLGEDSWVGGVGTVAARDMMAPAFSGGLDWNIRFDDGAYTVDGYVAHTHSSAAQQDGLAGRLLVSRIAAEHWFYTASYDFASRRFNPNDIGFFAQPHDQGGYAQVLYRENFAGGILRRYSAAFNPEYRWNWDGVMTLANLNVEFGAEFTNFWQGRVLVTNSPPAYDDAERGIIGYYKRPTANSVWLTVISDQRKSISMSLTAAYDSDVKRKRSLLGQVALTIRPAAWMEFSPTVFYSRTRNEEAWVFRGGNVLDTSVAPSPFSMFGDRDVDQLDLELRGIVTFTRDLSLQFFSQVFLARGRYDDYRRLNSDRELIPYIPSTAFTGADFNEITFNANLLLRWEYLPGSALYLVWTQGRYGDNGDYSSGFGRRLGDTFSMPHEDVLLLKVNYWLPL